MRCGSFTPLSVWMARRKLSSTAAPVVERAVELLPMTHLAGVHLGVVGATGQVGGVVRQLLVERNYPIASIRFFASARSAGTTIDFRGEAVVVEDAATA